MAEYVITLNLVANGNINPCSFVAGDTTTAVVSHDFAAIQAQGGTGSTGTTIIGISGTFPAGLPIGANVTGQTSSTFEATGVGDNLLVYPQGSTCLLTGATGASGANNAGGWTAFQFIAPCTDGSGYGYVPTNGSGALPVGAMGLSTVTAGQQGRVLVLPPGTLHTF